MCLGNGSTCPRARTRSSLISVKVRRAFYVLLFLPSLASLASFQCRTDDIVLSLYVFAGKAGCGVWVGGNRVRR